MVDKVVKSDAEWRRQLTPEQYRIARHKGTERPFTGAYHAAKEPGVYTCVCCGQPLFDSDTKFDSRTGWPSFYAPIDEDAVASRVGLCIIGGLFGVVAAGVGRLIHQKPILSPWLAVGFLPGLIGIVLVLIPGGRARIGARRRCSTCISRRCSAAPSSSAIRSRARTTCRSTALAAATRT